MKEFYTPTRRKPVPKREKGITWCGPYALATMTNLRSYESAESVIRQKCQRFKRDSWTGYKKPIKGMSHRDLVKCMESMGLNLVERYEARGKTVTQWYKSRNNKTGCYLVVSTTHFMLVHSTRFCDNHTLSWVSFRQHKGQKRARVTRVFQIYAMR